MDYAFAVKWLKAFRHSAEAICELYADDFVFEDPILDQYQIRDKGDLGRIFVLYANKDRENGLGVHNFRIRGYEGDRRSGLIRWEWTPEDAGNFIGLDVTNKPFFTQGHTFHVYDDDGRIVRESSWWDVGAILHAIGHPGVVKPRIPVAPAVPAA
ncbi:nuclear transport factor 2 family protein [Patulibacter defluvii]|uniref:nuclear transport factor 2 family protein n=1 Tax=Patulibacter defluvii TaxID=3095358 RepID=UPI002A75C0C5|nr:nuclear transport factor 2 family protein [Patulibacter sp. DM4]